MSRCPIGWTLALTAARLLGCTVVSTLSAEWHPGGTNNDTPVWGLRGGLQWALHPAGFGGGDGGPRGLIRLGSPVLTNGDYALVNFVALEPVVRGRRGFSELERSASDALPGKRFDVVGPSSSDTAATITRLPDGVEQCEVVVKTEAFENGAHVRLVLAQRSDVPDELQLTVHAESDSTPLDACILTSTMGNLARTRRLWLASGVVDSRRQFPGHQGNAFTAHARFPVEQLFRTPGGDVLVALTTDEENPARVYPFPGAESWHYAGATVTQYWRKRASQRQAGLKAVVNARATYWMSSQPIPGGIAFENFELEEPFHDGQTVVFGITRCTPEALGFRTNHP